MHFDFTALLVMLSIVTGLVALMDKLVWAKKRRQKLASTGEAQKMPTLIEYCRSFFPVILVVLLLRSFLFEPFRIPSSSMRPTLIVGDFIWVSKFAYGLRLPVLDTKIIPVGEPERGDIMVFRYPEDESIDYIKRVIGVPGDVVEYRNKHLYVNGEKAQKNPLARHLWTDNRCRSIDSVRYHEAVSGKEREILAIPERMSVAEGIWHVPEGHYFMLGDNRDNSRDSRYWNFVPERNIVGKAVAIWLSIDFDCGNSFQWDRIGVLD